MAVHFSVVGFLLLIAGIFGAVPRGNPIVAWSLVAVAGLALLLGV